MPDEDSSATLMPTIVKGMPNLQSVAGARIHEQNIVKEKAQAAKWGVQYREARDADHLARLGLSMNAAISPKASLQSSIKPTCSPNSPSIHGHGRNTVKQLDQHFAHNSELWGLYNTGQLSSYNDRTHFRRKMPVYYGSTLHSVSANGHDHSSRAH
eukprot:6192098-Pleurochrysis_carterae.AAC.2